MNVPRFLADENLRHDIVAAASRVEPAMEFATVVDLGLSGSSDEHILEYAMAHGQIVVSHDVRTMRPAADFRIRNGMGMRGLLLVPQSRATQPVVESLLMIWSASDADEWMGQIAYLPL